MCKKIVLKLYLILCLLSFKMLKMGEVPDYSIFPEIAGSLMHVLLSGWSKTERLKEGVFPVTQNALFEKQGNS